VARLYPGPLGATVSQCWSCAPVSGSLRAPTDGASVLWQWDSRRGDHDKFRLLALPRCLRCLQYRLFLLPAAEELPCAQVESTACAFAMLRQVSLESIKSWRER
jgi:hypothetical protein